LPSESNALSEGFKTRVEYLKQDMNREETFQVVTSSVARICYLIDTGSPFVQTSLFKDCKALAMKKIENLQKIGDLSVEEAGMMNIFQRAIKDKIEPFETSMRGAASEETEQTPAQKRIVKRRT